ncbi:hypothetical protein LTR85_005632 [Meristemomyces frigidus]|nr:hypothetical protein LTR85_005632 [Meristemomyces frigidus]
MLEIPTRKYRTLPCRLDAVCRQPRSEAIGSRHCREWCEEAARQFWMMQVGTQRGAAGSGENPVLMWRLRSPLLIESESEHLAIAVGLHSVRKYRTAYLRCELSYCDALEIELSADLRASGGAMYLAWMFRDAFTIGHGFGCAGTDEGQGKVLYAWILAEAMRQLERTKHLAPDHAVAGRWLEVMDEMLLRVRGGDEVWVARIKASVEDGTVYDPRIDAGRMPN